MLVLGRGVHLYFRLMEKIMAEETEEEKVFDYTTKANEEGENNAKKTAKDTAGEIGKTILEYIDKGVEAGKRGFKSAGEAISDFGDKSVKNIELAQLKTRKNKAFAQLGKYVWETLKLEENTSLSKEDEKIKYYMEGLAKLEADITSHEKFFEEAKSKKQ